VDDATVRIFLADGQAMVRQGLSMLIATDRHLKVVGQCGEGLQVIPAVKSTRPDVVVMDITLRGLNGLDVCRELTRKVEDVAVLILTGHDEEHFITRALDCGASGYLSKDAEGRQLIEAIHRVSRGELHLGPQASQAILHHIGRREDDPYNKLTARERQVLQAIVESKTNRQVALHLGIAVKTVDTHRTRLMRKLDIHDQTALVKYAIRKGVISLD
jgi:two-component system, NarL family, response regulator NreC